MDEVAGDEQTFDDATMGTLDEPPEVDYAEDPTDPDDNGHAPASVFDELRTQYAQATEDRRFTIMIAPGRFGNKLAIRCKPGPWTDYRKRAERMFRKGGGEEIELQFAASVLVACCETILYRPSDSGPLVPMAETNRAWRGTEPVRFDRRLADALGIEIDANESPTRICRLAFKNPAALNDAFVQLDAWLKEQVPSDDADEDADRPT